MSSTHGTFGGVNVNVRAAEYSLTPSLGAGGPSFVGVGHEASVTHSLIAQTFHSTTLLAPPVIEGGVKRDISIDTPPLCISWYLVTIPIDGSELQWEC